jgi:hypothetical protein
MKRLILFIAAIGLFLAACTPSTPNLVLDTQTYDLGTVTNGDVLSFEIPLVNEGSGKLVIMNVSTSCGCTSGRVEPAELDPDEEGVLIVEFDSGAHGPDANGSEMRQVYITSNDPDESEVTFEFTVEVLPAAQ